MLTSARPADRLCKNGNGPYLHFPRWQPPATRGHWTLKLSGATEELTFSCNLNLAPGGWWLQEDAGIDVVSLC